MWNNDKAFEAWLNAEHLGTDENPLTDETIDLMQKAWEGACALPVGCGEELIERLAALEHDQWAHWTEYMLGVLTKLDPTCPVGWSLPNITMEAIARWRRQIQTPYTDLTEIERESDRVWARKAAELMYTPPAPTEHAVEIAKILRKPYTWVLIADDSDGHSGFSAKIKEFPGCYAEGRTAAEAAANLEVSAVSWLESVLVRGLPVPPPTEED